VYYVLKTSHSLIHDKAPSRADIQKELIEEEQGNFSIHGQTSWILCGIRIQEMQYEHVQYMALTHQTNSVCRLALRYQLRSGGSHHTLEESQIIENKRIRLQKLIDMFEYQADAFLLQHQPMNVVEIPSLADYAQYDHVDDIDDSEVVGITLQISNAFGSGGHNAEDIPVLLPSTLGGEWCTSHGAKSLAIKEAKLRCAQANDSIHGIRLALGFKSALFRTLVRNARTQQTKTRAWSAIQSVDNSVHYHARNYSIARDAYIRIQDILGEPSELPELTPTDLRVNTAILGGAEVGQRNKQLPWIWSFGISDSEDGSWMDDCKSFCLLEHMALINILYSQSSALAPCQGTV
jgi:hypothetical protein